MVLACLQLAHAKIIKKVSVFFERGENGA